MREIRFIELYCAVCYHYDNTLAIYAQRNSNNFCPKFSDEECIAILIWGIANQKFDVKRCYEFIVDYYGEWFPTTYPVIRHTTREFAFLLYAFKALAGVLLCGLGLDSSHADFAYDSMPIVIAGASRSSKARVASELCLIRILCLKRYVYYGTKLHILAQCNHKAAIPPFRLVGLGVCAFGVDFSEKILAKKTHICYNFNL